MSCVLLEIVLSRNPRFAIYIMYKAGQPTLVLDAKHYVAEDGYDPVYEAQLEAHHACNDMIDTMARHLEALETGTLTEQQRHSLSDETDNLMKTVKLKIEKVHPTACSMHCSS